MSLKARLEAEPLKLPGRLCPVVKLQEKLDAEDYAYIRAEIDRPMTDPQRRSTTILVRVLADEGVVIASGAVDKHRRKDCACWRNGR